MDVSDCIENCYSRGSATKLLPAPTTVSNDWAAGFVARIRGNEAVIKNCYSTGFIYYEDEEEDPSTCGFIAEIDDNAVYQEFNNLWDSSTSGQLTSACNATPKSTKEMKDPSTFISIDWDFDEIWTINTINDEYPYLQWQET